MERRFKNYKDCFNYLFELERGGIKYNLKNTKALLKSLNNPHKEFKSIHIAGTNGKGSVAAIINSVFLEKGLKTGLFTSPHIKDFRERILVNGKMISQKFIIDFMNNYYELIEEIKPSFYEVSTALAFDFFRTKKVEYAIIETGLGGRLDSTNVLKPILSIITGISIDHTEYLGNTLKSIAGEKAGIIKRNTPCILGSVDKIAKRVISDKCISKNSKLIYAPEVCDVKIYNKNDKGFKFNFISEHDFLSEVDFPIVGSYQSKNICTSMTALNIISKFEDVIFSEADFLNGFKNIASNSKFYGRFQLLDKNPTIVIDVSHNSEGLSNIKSNLEHFEYNQVVVMFALMKDKEYKKCLNEIEKLNVMVVLTKPEYKRSINPEELYKKVKNKRNFVIKEKIKEAYLHAKRITSDDDLILITGSFFLVSEFLKIYNNYFKSN